MSTSHGKDTGLNNATMAKRAWLLLPLFVIAFTVYFQGLHGPLLLDDYPALAGLLEAEKNGAGLAELVTEYTIGSSGPLGRPVSMLSFIFNAALFGDDIFYWKLVNLGIHCLNTLFLFLLLRRLDDEIIALPEPAPKSTVWLPALCSAFWLLNPAQLSTVLYTVQRMNLLATMFTLLALLSYVRGRQALREMPVSSTESKSALLFFLLFVLSLVTAVLSKENAILGLGFILLIELYFFNAAHTLIQRITLKTGIRGKWVWITAVFFFLVLLYVAVEHYLPQYESRPFSMGERLLTESRVIFFYLYQFVVPLPANLGFFHDDLLVSKSLLSPLSTLTSVLGILLALALIKPLYHKHRWLSFAIAWFLLGHSLESSFLPLELMFEHRNYLPSVGIGIAIAYLLCISGLRAKPLAVVSISLLTASTLLLGLRSNLWSEQDRLYLTLLQYKPNSLNLISGSANILIQRQQYPLALQLLDKRKTAATLLHKNYARCLLQSRPDAAELQQAKDLTHKPIDSYWVSAATKLVSLGLEDQCQLPAQLMAEILATGGDNFGFYHQHYTLYLYLAHWLRKQQHKAAAYAILLDLRRQHPEVVTPLFLYTDWLLDDAKPEEAKTMLSRAEAEAKQANPALYRNFSSAIRQRLANFESESTNPTTGTRPKSESLP